MNKRHERFNQEQQIHVWVNRSTWKKTQVHAILAERELGGIVNEALENYLASMKPEKAASNSRRQAAS